MADYIKTLNRLLAGTLSYQALWRLPDMWRSQML